MSSGPFYQKNDIGAINKLVDKRTPRTESEGIVMVVEQTGFAWVQIRGASNAVAVDIVGGLTIKQGDKVALRRLPGASRWSIYAVQSLNGTAGSGTSSQTLDSTSSVSAPSNLSVDAVYGGVLVAWEPPNDTGDVLFEVELSSDGIGTGATVYKVAGSLFYYPSTTIQYARVRSLGTGWSRSGFTGRLSATPLNFNELVEDRVAGLLVAGSNVTLTYNDPAGTLTIAAASPALTVEEGDLSPSIVPVSKIIFPAGSLTNDGGGVARVAFPVGGDVATIKKTVETRTVIYDTTLSVDGPIDITGIPSGYDRLEFVGDLRTAAAGTGIEELYMFFNNDTTQSNYWFQQAYGYAGGSAGGGGAASNDIAHVWQAGTYFPTAPLPMRGHIDSYSNTAKYKAVFAESLTYGAYLMFRHTQWANTSAINRISLAGSVAGNSFKAGSRFQLIGIKTEQVVTAVSGDGTMALSTTKAEIDTYTRLAVYDFLVDTAGPVTFLAIDQGYDHLEVRMSVRGTAASDYEVLSLSINGDTTDANYIYVEHYGGDSSGGSVANIRTLSTVPSGTGISGRFQPYVIHFGYYATTDRHKLAETLYSVMRTSLNYRMNESLEWKNTAAITSLSLSIAAGSFKAGSVFELWGIKRKSVVTDITGDLTTTVKEYETNFDYTTGSPLALRTVGTNEKIVECKIIIDTAFDAATTLHVGEMGGTSRLMATAENDPLRTGVNISVPEFIYSGGEIVNLYITTSATAGAGRVCLVTKG